MKYLVDSDWVADWLVGRDAALALLTELSPDGLAISIITFGEISEGIYFGRDPKRIQVIFRRFLREVRVLLITRPVMQQFARTRGTLRQQGQLIGDMDLLIAATALHHKLTLVTRNMRHFERIPGLQLYR